MIACTVDPIEGNVLACIERANKVHRLGLHVKYRVSEVVDENVSRRKGHDLCTPKLARSRTDRHSLHQRNSIQCQDTMMTIEWDQSVGEYEYQLE